MSRCPAPGGPGGGTANETALQILTKPGAIAINQEYCEEADCGIASGGDLLSVLQAQAGDDGSAALAELSPGESLPPRPFPTLVPCGGASATPWEIAPIEGEPAPGSGSVCTKGGMCWNQQQCSETVIVYHGQTKRIPGNGCENSTNQVSRTAVASVRRTNSSRHSPKEICLLRDRRTSSARRGSSQPS